MFGQQNSTPFGSPPAGNTPFGNTANSTPAFGSPAPAFGGGSAFGSNTAGGGGFGSGTTTSAFGSSGGGFGAPAPAPAFGFGAPSPAPSAFGASTTNSSPFGAPAPSGGLFGAPAPAPSGGLFGSSNTTSNAFGGSNSNAFGSTNTSTFGGFGSSNTTSTFGAPAPAFGAPAPATGGLFGAPAPAPSGGLFGSTPAPSPFGAPAPSGGLFGAPAPAAGSMFGAPATDVTGGIHSKVAPFQATTRQDGTSTITFQSITAMNQYEQSSFEEIRFGDYSQGNKGDGSGQAASTGFGGFGSTPAPAPGGFGLFGNNSTSAPAPFGATGFGSAPAPAPAFGAPAPAFGAPSPAPAFGGFGSKPGGLFGAPAPAPTGGLFGGTPAPAPFGAAPAPTGGLFGAPAPAPGGGLFGAPAPAPTGGLFGSTPAPAPFGAAPAPSGGLFGSSAPAPGSGGLFGAPAPAGGLFGSAPAPGAFGAAPSSGLFGSKPSSGSLFGAPAPAPGGGLFGAPAPSGGLFGAPAPAAQPPAFASPMSQPANIMPQAADAVLQQQIAALQNQRTELDKLEVWRGKSPQASSIVPTSLSQSEAGLRVSPYSSSTAVTQYRASPRSTTKIRPRGFGSPVPTSSAAILATSIGTASSPMVSPGTAAISSAKRLVIKPDAHTPKPKIRLQLTDRAAEEKKSEDHQAALPAAETPARSLADSALHLDTPQPVNSPEPVRSPQQQTRQPSTRSGAYDLYMQVIGTQKEKPKEPTTSVAPKMTKPGYISTPPIEELKKLSEAELAAVPNFMVSREDIGSVAWEGVVDVRGVDIDSVVSIELMDVSVYEEQENAGTKPAQGAKLNRPAVITLNKTYPKKGGAGASLEAKMKFSRKLEKTCQQMGTEFISYDHTSGTWKFRVTHFSRYGLYDDDDDDDDDDGGGGGDEVMVVEDTTKTPKPVTKSIVNFESGGRGGRSPAKKGSPTRFTVPDSDDEDDSVDVVMGDDEGALVSDAEMEKTKERQAAAHLAYQELFLSRPLHEERAPIVEEEPDDGVYNDVVHEPKTRVYREVFIPGEGAFVLGGKRGITSRIARKAGVGKVSTDLGVRLGRSFRVGWRPDGSFLHLSSGSVLAQSRPVFSQASPSSQLSVLDTHRRLAEKDESDKIPSYSLGRSSLTKAIRSLADTLASNNDEGSSAIYMVFQLLSCLLKEATPTSSAIVAVDGSSLVGSDVPWDTAQAMEGFQRWLMEVCSQSVKEEIHSAKKENDAPKAIFAALSAGDVSQAAELASSFATTTASASEQYAYLQLAAMLSSGFACPSFVQPQLHAWRQKGLDRKTSPRTLRVYTLLSGDLGLEQELFRGGDASVNWMRRLGLLLQYGRKEDGGELDFASLIDEYDSQVAGGLAPRPKPLYVGADDEQSTKSILYQLVRLCDAIVRREQDSAVSLADIISPAGYTSFFHDYSGAFLVAAALSLMNCCNGLSDEEQTKVLNGYATQLIGEGNWEYAVYVMLCQIGGTASRRWRLKQAKDIVLQNHRSGTESKFLVKEVGVPLTWFAEASADRAANSGNTLGYVSHLACVSGVEARKALEDISVPAILFRDSGEIVKSVKTLGTFPVDNECLSGCVLELYSLSGEIVQASEDEMEDRETQIRSLIERADQVETKLSLFKAQHENLVRPSLRASKSKVPVVTFLVEALSAVALMKLQLQALEGGESIFDDKQEAMGKAVSYKLQSQLMVAVGSKHQPHPNENVDLSVFI